MRKGLDSFTNAYLEAIQFTDCHADNPELQHAAVSNDLINQAKADCEAFQAASADDLATAYQMVDGYDEARAGHDYWLTRNGHGAGFWDRGLGAVGERLSDAAQADGGRDAYAGDDGLIYLS